MTNKIEDSSKNQPISPPSRLSITKIMLRAIKLPVLLFIIGFALVWGQFIKLYFSKNWEHFFFIISNVGVCLMILALFLTIYNFISLLCYENEKNLVKKNYIIGAQIVSTLRKGIKIIFILILINLGFHLFNLENYNLYLADKTISAILVCFIGWMMLQVVSISEAAFYKYKVDLPQENKKKSLYTRIHIIKNILVFIILTLTIASLLMLFDKVRNVGISLLASAGFLTAILGLAAQQTLSSLFSGLQLALSQSIQIDDAVIVENEYGWIEDVSLSHVIVRLWDLRRLVLPANYFNTKPFQNWSIKEGAILGSVFIYVDFNFPVNDLRNELKRILNESPWWTGKLGVVHVTDCKPDYMEIRIIFTTKSPDILFDARAEVREKLIRYIQVNYPQFLPIQRTHVEGLGNMSGTTS